MKRLLIIALTTLAFASTTAHAIDDGQRDKPGHRYHQRINEQHAWPKKLVWWVSNHKHDSRCGHGAPVKGPVDKGSPAAVQVPELDASGAALALLLLAGLLAARREMQPGN